VRRLVVLLALAAAAAAGARADAATPRSSAFYLSQAQQGLAQVQAHWWNAKAGWYNDTYNGEPPTMPLARLWSAYPLFETLSGVAVAQPTAANLAALRTFADNAARLYWNPNVKPIGGYGWYPGQRGSTANVYYDDSGWWGLAFLDAYAATKDRAYLTDARRAMQFIVGSGWDAALGGGTWWDTFHHHKTIEPLAAAVLIGTRLYAIQHDTWALRWAQKLLAWANARSFNKPAGLYQRSSTDATVMDYVQGLMITANWELCKRLQQPSLCTKARRLANAAYTAFPRNLNWAPQYDVVYLRWMLEYFRESGDARFHDLAAYNAERALASINESGYYLNRWDGTPLADGLEEEAASLELFAWLAATT
jgi:glycosyl hydrolase family 76